MARTPTLAMCSVHGSLLQPGFSLPFLYNTRTICTGSACWSTTNAKHLLNTTPPKGFFRRKVTSEFPGGRWRQFKLTREPVHRTKSDPAPSKPDNFQAWADDRYPQSNTDSTLTRNERDIFERIYRDVIGELPIEVPDIEGRDSEHALNNSSFDESSSLESIFEVSISVGTSNSYETRSTQLSNVPVDMSTGLPTSLRDAKPKSTDKYANGIEMLRTPESSSSEREQSIAIVKSLQAHRFSKEEIKNDSRIFQERLAATKSDKDVWDLLKKFVFTRMAAVAQEVMKQASERPAKLDNIELPEKPKKQPVNSNTITGAIASPRVPWQQHPSIVRELSVLRANYASQCAACLNMLRKKFPYSPYMLAILPEIKSLGPISYVLGVSTELYNELLYVSWVHYRDLSGCADLVSEMLDRSVFPDARTRAVFKDAERTRSQASEFWNRLQFHTAHHKVFHSRNQQALSPSATAWWLLQGVQNGWSKWQAIEAQVDDEQARRRAAHVAAREDDYDDEDEDEALEKLSDYEKDIAEDEPDIRVVIPVSNKEAEQVQTPVLRQAES